ncbi:universal stress protein [Actinospica sp. MGRD01-02]|uniref:Universal stress protein n=1 Tax=Actinospica acidithermotolerans TaxID=2828514 RepID=A0A941INY5_9ACTN|nr:universal stress protein [Actinospica acidithermotolerans]MBR7829931.1 universal stress protein [Actinospica acidithermotolerans]
MTTIHAAPVVVGLDLTDASVHALIWAAREASVHDAPLEAVHVVDLRGAEAVYSESGAHPAVPPDEAVERIKELIRRAGVGPVERVFEVGVPGRVLVHRSRGARMLVLGQASGHHHGLGDAYRPAPELGPVARACVASAECPVVIVPEPAAAPSAADSTGERHEAAIGGRALYPYQGRIPFAHH